MSDQAVDRVDALSPKVVVVGAGVLGLFCAWRLAQGGARVTLYEAQPDRPNASAVAAGMIAPASEVWLEPALREIAPAALTARTAWSGVAAELGVPLSQAGARHTGSAQERHAQSALWRSLGFVVRCEPDALVTPQDALIAPGPALAALRRLVAAAGGRVRAGRVTRGAAGFAVEGEAITADAVVLACGIAERGSGLAPELALLSPIKGQLLRFGPALQDGPVLRAPAIYVASHPHEVVAGATMEPGRDDLDPDPVQIDRLHRAAADAAPALEGLTPTVGVGVRAATPDGLPIVGPSGLAGVFLATGARRNGWLFAPLVGEIIAAQVLGRPLGALAPLAERLHPSRFITGEAT